MKDLLESQTTIAGLQVSLFALFQALFAAITVALISGAAADRMKFGAWMVFAGLWAVLVYFPVAHWVFAFDGVGRPRTPSAAGSPTTSRRSTSPVAPRCTSTQAPPLWPSRSCSASPRVGASCASRTTCR